jgi:tRNA-splicing ligase RtcB
MLHTGSRGLGYQVCADFLAAMQGKPDKAANPTGDAHLACAMADSRAGRDYLAAMAAAANYAYANRAAIAYHAGETLRALFGKAGFAMRNRFWIN